MAPRAGRQDLGRRRRRGSGPSGKKIPGSRGSGEDPPITRVGLSRFVEDDLDAIAGYIAQDNPARAVSFIREIRAKFRAIGQRPMLYRLRPEIGEDARLALVGQYAILFRVLAGAVRIERIVYGGRDLPALFAEE